MMMLVGGAFGAFVICVVATILSLPYGKVKEMLVKHLLICARKNHFNEYKTVQLRRCWVNKDSPIRSDRIAFFWSCFMYELS